MVVDENMLKNQKYLDNALEVIDEQIKTNENMCEKEIDEVRALSKYHWEHKTDMDEVEKMSSRNIINLTASIANQDLSRLRNLRLARKNPFFGKIKVNFEDLDDETYYIGITSVMKDNNFIINDWRSPIANLFYNSKLGKTSYKAPVGIVDCNLLKREQIKIKNDKIDRIIDSSIHISDDELQETLSKSSSDKMKNIVNTIQEEQNEIIRNVTDKNIIVQGCAGSGKTSVALHRISYLLYNDIKLNENNMLIFSPSDTFSSYISDVLPDLGNSNVLETTFSDFANSFISKSAKIETFIHFISKYYDQKFTSKENDLNKFKFSEEYKNALDKFIKKYTDLYRFKEDIELYNTFIPKDLLNNVLDNYSGYPLQEKIDVLTIFVAKLFKNISVSKSIIRRSISKQLIKPSFDPINTYNKFMGSEEFIESFGQPGEKISRKMISYPDLIGILYLNFEFMGYPKNDLIHHLVIDEVQDYSPLQISMIRKMFEGASFTVLGDINQTINPYYRYESLENIKNYLGNSKYIELNKAYRSSKEIMEYVKEILNDTKIEPVRNPSSNNVLVKDIEKDELFKTLVKDIITLKENGFERVCIITKNSNELNSIYEVLKNFIDLTIIKDDAKLNNNTFLQRKRSIKSKDKNFKKERLIEYFSSKDRVDVTDPNYKLAIKLDKMIAVYYSKLNDLEKYLVFKELFNSRDSFLNDYRILKGDQTSIVEYFNNYVKVISEFVKNMENNLSSEKEKEYKRYKENGYIDDYNYASGYVNLYINYKESPYLYKFLKTVGLLESDFKRFVNIVYELDEDLYKKYTEKEINNKNSRLCDVITKMDNFYGMYMNKDEEFNRVEFYRNLPFIDMESSNEIVSDFKLKKLSNVDQRLKALIEHFYPEEVRNMTKFIYDNNLITKEFKKITEKEIENTNYIINDVVLTKDMKDEIIDYMKENDIPFLVVAFNAVRDKYLNEGLNKGKKLIK